MAAIDFLRERGFTATKSGMRIRIAPASKLTADVRQYVKSHRLELLAELAANDGIERRCYWQVVRDGKPLCTMISEPITYAEALAEVQWRWLDATIQN
ncbi:hypothetical protein KV580_22100 [Pseudomonas chlororaphis]|nr:hypothetical protein [Pseudomonas chlororaphis]